MTWQVAVIGAIARFISSKVPNTPLVCMGNLCVENGLPRERYDLVNKDVACVWPPL